MKSVDCRASEMVYNSTWFCNVVAKLAMDLQKDARLQPILGHRRSDNI